MLISNPTSLRSRHTQAHRVAIEPRMGILHLWPLRRCSNLTTTDKVEEVWNQPVVSHFSNTAPEVGRKHELRLGTLPLTPYNQSVVKNLQLSSYAISQTHLQWPDAHLGTHLPYTPCPPPCPRPSPSLTFIFLSLEASSPGPGPSEGIMLTDLNQVFLEAAPERQVLTYIYIY